MSWVGRFAVAFAFLVLPSGALAATTGARNGAIVFSSASRDAPPTNGSQQLVAIGPRGERPHALTAERGVRHIDPTWSPDGARLAFVQEDSRGIAVVVMRKDGTGRVEVTSPTATIASDPAWSPDGNRLAIVVVSSEGTEWIGVVGAGGGPIRRLADGAWPSWSPDGRSIAARTPSFGLELVDVESGRAHELSLERRVSGAIQWTPDFEIAYESETGGGPATYAIRPDGTGDHEVARGGLARWSPDGERIAVAIPGVAVRVLRADGVAVADIPESVHVIATGWSPDSRRLLLVVDEGTRQQLVTVQPTGLDRRRITRELFGTGIEAAEWSPDGSTIVYVRLRDWNDSELFSRSDAGFRTLTHDDVPDGDAAWSPDGSTLAYVHGTSGFGTFGVPRIRLLEVARGRARDLDLVGATEPAWSPDGARLVVVAEGETQDAYLQVVDLSGRGLRFLGRGRAPAWSPDGKLIAYSADAQIRTVRPDGRGHRTLLRLPVPVESGGVGYSYLTNPAWSPDGTRIAFDAFWDHGSASYLMRSDGSHARKIASAAGTPSWSPDGRFLVLAGERVSLATSARKLIVRERTEVTWQPLCTRTGTARRDSIRGSSRPELLCGRDGDDAIAGGGASDRLFGGRGDDWIDARDGRRDVVGCGPGRDVVAADRVDLVGRDCEVVRRR